MKAFVIITLLFINGIKIFGQENHIVWIESRPLNWFDFAGQVIDTSQYDAESFAEVRYNYQSNGLKDLSFEVFANFNRNTSWCRDRHRSEALLKHEQIHFDIAELYARKLKRAFEEYQYSINYNDEILKIFNEKKQEYHLMQRQYDEETNHSLNRMKQKEWESKIQDGLSQWKVDVGYVKK